MGPPLRDTKALFLQLQLQMQIFSAWHSGSVVAWKSSLECDIVKCNVLVISILYNGETEVLSVVFHVFYLNIMPFSMPGKIAKRIVLFSCFTQFGACNEAYEPHFSALDTQNSTSAPLFRCPEPPFLIPQTTIWDVPFCHLGYFKECLCPHIGAVLPSLCADFFPL